MTDHVNADRTGQSGPVTHRTPVAVPGAMLAAALLIASAGCSSSGKQSNPTTSTSAAAPSSAPSTSIPTGAALTAELAQIKQVWTRFFAGPTPAAQKVSLLQNGSAFASVIAAQVNSPMAKQTTAIVTRVSLTSIKSATVNYGIALSGKLALPNQLGFAVKVDNGWRVSATSFCQLLTLEGQHPAACTASPSPSATG